MPSRYELKKRLKPIYFAVRQWLNRGPLWIAQGLHRISGGTLFDPNVLRVPTATLSVPDWVARFPAACAEAPQYHLVDEATQFVRQTPAKTADPQPHPQFAREQRAHPPSSFVVTVPQGRVWGEYGAIITPEHSLLQEVSVYRLQPTVGRHRVFSDWHLCRSHRLTGTAAVLATDSAGIYYHWCIDLLLRYGLLLRAGWTLEAFDHIIIGSDARRFQAEMLAMLGLKTGTADKLVRTADYPLIQADCLVVPSYPAMGGQYRPWQVAFLRETLIPAAIARVPPNFCQTRAGKRIYISRGDATYRRVLNQPAVIELLSQYGFEEVRLGELSCAEQIALMTSVEAVVAPHGSGLTNVLFCAPGTRVIELFSPEMVALYFWKLADLCQLDYYYTVGERLRSAAYDQTWNAQADIRVSLERLQQTLEMAGLG